MEILARLQNINDKLSRLAPKHLSLAAERDQSLTQIGDMMKQISSLENQIISIKSVNQETVLRIDKLLDKLD